MKPHLTHLVATALLFASASAVLAQGTAFTYQGQLLNAGAPVTGSTYLNFALYRVVSGDSPIPGGGPIAPIGGALVNATNGLFTVILDFGSNPNPFTGQSLWLEIEQSPSGNPGTYTAFTPRVQLSPAPYAIFANTSSNLSGTVSVAQLNGTVGNNQLANSSININPGAGLSGGGAVALGGTTTLNNAGVLSVTGNADITASTASGAVTLGDTATSTDTASTIVKRDGSGSFSAGSVTLGASLNLPATGVSPDIIHSGSALLLYADNNENFFSGQNAGSATTSGLGQNTANGALALSSNTSGNQNTAVGVQALNFNTSGNVNTAVGAGALERNTDGIYNTAIGAAALTDSTTGSYNTAVGTEALYSIQGSNNIALGYLAGNNIASGSSNIDIGNIGASGDNNIIRIGTLGIQTSAYLAGDLFLSGNGTPNEALNVSGSVRLNDHNIYFRPGTDGNHGLGFYGNGSVNGDFAGLNVNGPVLWGNGGGALGVVNGSSQAIALYWNSGDQIGIGTTSPAHKLDVNGDFGCTSITVKGGSDLAEPFELSTADTEIPQGSVVVIDDQNPGHLKISDEPFDIRVAGVISGANGVNPGIQMRQQGLLDGGRNVALSGRVYVLADASHGAIKPGDLLTTSSTPGHAMKVTDHAKAQGAILGKAMTGLRDGQGMVLVLVTLQ